MMHRIALIGAALLGGLLLACIPQIARSHDIYSDWKQPGTGMSCCNAVDCYPTEARFEQGQWFALRREDQRWLAIPDRLVLTDGATPDGKAHLCAPAPLAEEDLRIYCFRPPAMGM
jgi:hypothetical protein